MRICYNFEISFFLQVKLSEKVSLLETAEGKIAELTAKVDEQQKLIQKLEDDILKVWIKSLWMFWITMFSTVTSLLTMLQVNH